MNLYKKEKSLAIPPNLLPQKNPTPFGAGFLDIQLTIEQLNNRTIELRMMQLTSKFTIRLFNCSKFFSPNLSRPSPSPSERGLRGEAA